MLPNQALQPTASSVRYYSEAVRRDIEAWPVGIRAMYARITERMQVFGPHLGMPFTRPMGEGLFEVRAKGKEGRRPRRHQAETLSLPGDGCGRYAVKTHDEMIATWKQDPAFRREYDALEGEFALFDALVSARHQAGLSQAEVAERIGTQTPAVARLEAGGGPQRHSPSLATLRKYAAAVGCRLEIKLVPLSQSSPEERGKPSKHTRPVRDGNHSTSQTSDARPGVRYPQH
ncbi:MAG: helix-turn-helix domain-containing protein [Candidatus Entotheonellia bacterium]